MKAGMPLVALRSSTRATYRRKWRRAMSRVLLESQTNKSARGHRKSSLNGRPHQSPSLASERTILHYLIPLTRTSSRLSCLRPMQEMISRTTSMTRTKSNEPTLQANRGSMLNSCRNSRTRIWTRWNTKSRMSLGFSTSRTNGTGSLQMTSHSRWQRTSR